MSPSAKKTARSGLRKTAHAAATARQRVGAHGVPNLDLTEAQWQARVTTLASFYGWRWYHPPDNLPTININKLQAEFEAKRVRGVAMRGVEVLARARALLRQQDIEPGFPDLVLVRADPDPDAGSGYAPGTTPRLVELLFAELKTETGRLGPGQAEWGHMLDAVSQEVRHARSVLEGEGWSADVDVGHHLWRPSQEDEVHDRLARGRVRIEPSWYVGELP